MQHDLHKENLHQAPSGLPLQPDGPPLEADASLSDPSQDASPQDEANVMAENISGDSSEARNQDLRVLFVDDHEDMRAMMQLLMKRRSYQVATAGSAREALEIAPQYAPDIVVSDIGMPEMDGYDLMVALRADNRMPHFKSIALTGYSLPSDRERAWETGYNACLSKPVSFTALFDLIDELATALLNEPR